MREFQDIRSVMCYLIVIVLPRLVTVGTQLRDIRRFLSVFVLMFLLQLAGQKSYMSKLRVNRYGQRN
ncbi:uncharacterized protein F4822DRAFT_398731 [Hypoxylon trugodes]|uniref:uncharacterized protein n=1 Tax=Hypoxylon trugodes TaxID=326681 RepID=UPI002190D867|nr:uncharacterized protein F4822DRAFT_398731 [Hypoxylon trugodes]KAI1389531.1 hypothetical protein F4822DRAFT_398731 [Hypoxylon trugodes]